MAPEGLAEASIAAALPLNSLCLILLPSPLISILSKPLLTGKCQSLWVCFPSSTIYHRDFGAESHAAKRNQSWIFLGRTDAEAEASILWPSDGKCWLVGKDPDAGKDWGQEERGVTEDEMAGWHHWFNGQESEQALGDKEGQWSLVCCFMGPQRVRHDLVTEQQKCMPLVGSEDPHPCHQTEYQEPLHRVWVPFTNLPSGEQELDVCRLECTGGGISQASESRNYEDFGIRLLLLRTIGISGQVWG